LKSLPKKLKREPLIDVVYELRFNPLLSASTLLPGVFFSKFNVPCSKTHISEVPESIRKTDPNLKYQPIFVIELDKIRVGIADSGISVNCKMPYAGWDAFKAEIKTVLNLLEESKIVLSVERCSLRYLNIVDPKDYSFLGSPLSLVMSMNAQDLLSSQFNLQIEVKENQFGLVQKVALASGATAYMNDQVVRTGMLIDIDTIFMRAPREWIQFKAGLDGFLDSMHDCGKSKFFECLSEDAINKMEPVE
jgi:uncharacterized protein (TIGR04255 family)